MSQIAMPTPHRPVLASRRTTTRRNSFTDDEDAITPCSSPPPEPSHPTFASAYDLDTKRPASPRFTPSRRGSTSPNTASSSSSSAAAAAAAVGGSAGPSRKASTVGAPSSFHFDPTEGEELSDAQLWRRMLAIQQEFHCYNSARLSAALLGLEMGVDVGQLARKSCIFFRFFLSKGEKKRFNCRPSRVLT